MIIKIKKIYRTIVFLITILLIFLVNSSTPYSISRKFNQHKHAELKEALGERNSDLILLTVTGDQRYKNKELIELYKNLQIIHVLVISGSNIAVVLSLIHLFIYRKSMISYIISLIFIYLYGSYINFPETILRAILTTATCSIHTATGQKERSVRTLTVVILVLIFPMIFTKTGLSYLLSTVFFLTVFLNSNFVKKFIKSKIDFFLITNTILALVTSIIFSHQNFSITCTSFIANIIIINIYEYATYLSYLSYILPFDYVGSLFPRAFKFLFDVLFYFLNIIYNLTYNICNV